MFSKRWTTRRGPRTDSSHFRGSAPTLITARPTRTAAAMAQCLTAVVAPTTPASVQTACAASVAAGRLARFRWSRPHPHPTLTLKSRPATVPRLERTFIYQGFRETTTTSTTSGLRSVWTFLQLVFRQQPRCSRRPRLRRKRPHCPRLFLVSTQWSRLMLSEERWSRRRWGDMQACSDARTVGDSSFGSVGVVQVARSQTPSYELHQRGVSAWKERMGPAAGGSEPVAGNVTP